jgi:outer membrane protein assembly factor BamB
VITDDYSFILANEGIYGINRAKYDEINKQLSEHQDTISHLSRVIRNNRGKLDGADADTRKAINKENDEATRKIYELQEIIKTRKSELITWSYKREGLTSIILTKNLLIAAGEKCVLAISAETGTVEWEETIEGKALGIAVANERIFISTKQGAIYCFAEKSTQPTINIQTAGLPYEYEIDSEVKQAAAEIVKQLPRLNGWGLVFNAGTGELAYELAKQTELNLVCIETDIQKLQKARAFLQKMGLYGHRVVVQQWNKTDLPDYFADIIVSGDPLYVSELDYSPEELFRILKPYGGILALGCSEETLRFSKPDYTNQWDEYFSQAKLQKGSNGNNWITFIRPELPNAGQWTSLYGNPENTCCSEDPYVKTPLGVLWYGEPGSEDIVDRHGRAAGPVAYNGKLFIQGEEIVMCYDAYNGTKIWEREIDGAVRVRVDVDGSNLSLDSEALYVATKNQCYQLDHATGETINIFRIPFYEATGTRDGTPRRWGYVQSIGGNLLGSSAIDQKTRICYRLGSPR